MWFVCLGVVFIAYPFLLILCMVSAAAAVAAAAAAAAVSRAAVGAGMILLAGVALVHEHADSIWRAMRTVTNNMKCMSRITLTYLAS